MSSFAPLSRGVDMAPTRLQEVGRGGLRHCVHDADALASRHDGGAGVHAHQGYVFEDSRLRVRLSLDAFAFALRSQRVFLRFNAKLAELLDHAGQEEGGA